MEDNPAIAPDFLKEVERFISRLTLLQMKIMDKFLRKRQNEVEVMGCAGNVRLNTVIARERVNELWAEAEAEAEAEAKAKAKAKSARSVA